MTGDTDPDLPGDDTFVPAPPVVHIVVHTPAGPAWGMADTIGPDAQAAQHHNRLRYAELGKLRRGEPNAYHATRYRH